MKLRTLACALTTVLLTGCAGYNHTLFMTKSNAGLDFDAKPPTAEITISRKEAVIAPAFEGGQTPPVMASFKPDVGFDGSFGNFFLGVDQTFAGGDAAMAMTTLYGKTTAATDPTPFDSKLDLTAEPKAPIPMLDVAKPGKIRPFIFGTDTMLGLKVAWSGAGGQMPDSLKAGFNRKEFAWAPLMLTNRLPGSSGTQAQWSVKMPSFLATIDSTNKVGSEGNGISALQYFATGEAATRLAMQPDVRAAMLARFDPNQEQFKSRFRAHGSDVIPDVLFSAVTILERYKTRGDVRAAEHLERLGSLAGVELPSAYRNEAVPVYVFDPDGLVLKKNDGNAPVPIAQASLDAATGYLAVLEASYRNLTNALAQIALGKTVNLQVRTPTPQTNAVTAAMVQPLMKDRDELKRRSEVLIAQLASNPDVEAAYDYVQRKLNP